MSRAERVAVNYGVGWLVQVGHHSNDLGWAKHATLEIASRHVWEEGI